jgi:O-succinylbenzoate synthase
MKIERIELHHINMPLVHPFRTSFGLELERPCTLVAVYSDGLVGWGECVAMEGPWYSAETVDTAWTILHDNLAPLLIGKEIDAPSDAVKYIKRVRGNPMARAALENACWDLVAQAQNKPLYQLISEESGHETARKRVPVGVSIGIQSTVEQLLDRVDQFVSLGYQRIKCKIEPGWEVEPLSRVRERYPDVLLMGDANSAFTLNDVPMLRALDELDLLMIEQPLAYNDIADHARLQSQLKTAVCLDESIHSAPDVQAAIDLEACRIINMKVARVGGLTTAIAIHDMCQAAGIEMWCGGMLETGIGRSVNIHLATLPNFTLPGDISATDRYFSADIADPPFVLNTNDSTMTVPESPGIGVTVLTDRIVEYRVRYAEFVG